MIRKKFLHLIYLFEDSKYWIIFLLFVFGLILEIFHKNCKPFTFDVFTCNQAEIEGLVDLYFTVKYKR